MEEKDYWVAFSVFPGIGPVRFKLLLDYFGSARKAWEAPASALKNIHLGNKLSDDFVEFRKSYDISSYLKDLRDKKIFVLTINDPRYPAHLKKISDPPFVLYVKGRSTYTQTRAGTREKVPLDLTRTIGVVGTRKITHYGTQVTKRLVTELVSYGFTIISGLAYGVDAVAHQSALDAGGKTIAVLGCGIDIIAPPSNARLYNTIADGGSGAIVSEMPLGLRPNKGLFPARNRIISGLSLGVIVTEGADDSGALITARNAGEQGREVFAVPGPITSAYSKGPAALIKKGAKLVEKVEDILEELGVSKTSNSSKPSKTSNIKGETKEEQKILDSLKDMQMHVDELVRATGLTTSNVAATLSVLEIRGIVKDYGEKVYGLA